ncbi:MAG: response regulator [Verrucomicrobia bacterium]|nr:response regulator [Verrucomicrobiota bacterium]
MKQPPAARILVVDDTPANLSLLLDALTEAGHEILVAESGRSALSLLEHTTPDLVLLDFVMPGMDGLATCLQIKQRADCRDVPVLFMTAVDESEQKVRAFAAGAVDYITKPAYPPEVLSRVAAHLQIRALQRSLADELALRVEAENALSQSLDRAVLVLDVTGRIVFGTRLAFDLIHRHFPDQAGAATPRLTDTPSLSLRRFSEAGRIDLTMLVLEERGAPPGPAALMQLGLTAREAEVLYWIAQGKSNPDIATILGASVRTVHKHVEHVFQKLGLETRNAATLAALEILRPAAR